MKNANQNPSFSKLSQLLHANNFQQRNTAFFRLIGDGVLQVLQYKRTKRAFPHEDLNIGLFSLYGEIEPEWLTSRGCIPRYQAHWLEDDVKQQYRRVREKHNVFLDELSGIECYSINISFIESKLIPFLNSIQTQAQQADAIQFLDKEASGPVVKDILWNDALKIAPFLHAGQYDNAALVVESILKQHAFARSRNQALGIDLIEADDSIYLYLQKLIKESKFDLIQEYLQKNYAQNLSMTLFLR